MFKEEPNKFVVIVLAVIIALLIFRGAGKTVISTEAQKDAISVSATANVESLADKAELYIKVETLDKDAKVSQQKNSEASNAVIKELLLAGAAKNDVETSQYYLDQKIRYGKEGEQIVDGYVTIHVLKATTTKTNDVGSLIDAAIKGGANGINNIIFTLSDEKKAELRNEAIANAAAEAKGKATKIADSLGVKLGRLHTATESSFNYLPYYASYDVAAKAAPAPTQIEPQSVEVSATLSASYAIG